MKSFKDEVKKEFQSKELSPDQLGALMEIQKPSKRIPIFSLIAVAACVVLIMVNSMTFKLSSKVANEIAYNHLKNLPAEVLISDYTVINDHLKKLEFTVRDSQKLAGYTLVGARYCSIQGKTAAQIKLKSPDNKIVTLYQYELDSDFDLAELNIVSDNVKIKLWSEGNLHFGLAE